MSFVLDNTEQTITVTPIVSGDGGDVTVQAGDGVLPAAFFSTVIAPATAPSTFTVSLPGSAIDQKAYAPASQFTNELGIEMTSLGSTPPFRR